MLQKMFEDTSITFGVSQFQQLCVAQSLLEAYESDISEDSLLSGRLPSNYLERLEQNHTIWEKGQEVGVMDLSVANLALANLQELENLYIEARNPGRNYTFKRSQREAELFLGLELAT